MTERLLQYIWQFQYLNTSCLQTTQGQPLQIITPGTHNSNQGPDFLNAKIRIGSTTWAGNIELHVNAGEWNQHNHSEDKNYDNVILHVVWNEDADLDLPFACLELKHIVSKLLINNYQELLESRHFIPCEKQLAEVNGIVISKWKERLLIERLQQKSMYIKSLLETNNQHWEETFWWILARNFGAGINGDAFERTARSIPVNLLSRHKGQLLQLEALLMGQAGLLECDFKESYPIMLKKEYFFLKRKYKLKQANHPLYFLRMRPANFPTIRFAQLAMLIQQSHNLFGTLRETVLMKDAEKLFELTANDYWHYHYIFEEESSFKKKTLGKAMIANIFINTVIPMLYAYGHINNNASLIEKALNWIGRLKPEKNSITKGFELLGVDNNSAFDSQALIRLKQAYCDTRNCLNCAIGNAILKQTSAGNEPEI